MKQTMGQNDIVEIESEISVEVGQETATVVVEYTGDHGGMVATHEFGVERAGGDVVVVSDIKFVGKETGNVHESGSRFPRGAEDVADEESIRKTVTEIVEYRPHADYFALAGRLNG